MGGSGVEEGSQTVAGILNLNGQEHYGEQQQERRKPHASKDGQRSPHCLNNAVDAAADQDQEQKSDHMGGKIGEQITQDTNVFYHKLHRKGVPYPIVLLYGNICFRPCSKGTPPLPPVTAH